MSALPAKAALKGVVVWAYSYPAFGSYINRHVPAGNSYKTPSEPQDAAQIYTLGGGEAAWDLRWLFHRSLFSRGVQMINIYIRKKKKKTLKGC